MITSESKLTILRDDVGVFTDCTEPLYDLTRDTQTLTLADDEYLYIGFRKPINSFYIHINTVSTTQNNTITIEYYTGVWTEVNNLQDNTKGFTRSGFINWERPEDSAATSVNSTLLHWVRLSVSASTSAMVIQGLNIIFADDHALSLVVPEIIDDNHLAGKTSHINTHVAVREAIIQDLNNKNYHIINQSTGEKEDITPWDLLNTNQLRQAAINLALSMIYFNFSDSPDDRFSLKADHYYGRYQNAMKLVRLALDEDDDGVEDLGETQKGFSVIRITR